MTINKIDCEKLFLYYILRMGESLLSCYYIETNKFLFKMLTEILLKEKRNRAKENTLISLCQKI